MRSLLFFLLTFLPLISISFLRESLRRFAPRRLPSLGFLSLFFSLVFSTGALQAQGCVDYADYIHWVGSVDTPDRAYGVVVAGSYAYVADYYSGLQVIDISDPTSPWIVGSVDTPGSAYGVAVAGSYAYVADCYSGLQVLPAQCGLFIEATPNDASVPPGGTLVQDIVVTNTTDSSGTVQASFAARLPSNDFYPLRGPVPLNGVDVEGNSTFERTLLYPVPPNAPVPFIVGFLSYLLDYDSGDTLDIDETWVEIIEGGGMNTNK